MHRADLVVGLDQELEGPQVFVPADGVVGPAEWACVRVCMCASIKWPLPLHSRATLAKFVSARRVSEAEAATFLMAWPCFCNSV